MLLQLTAAVLSAGMAALVLGVGLTPFVRPDPKRDYAEQAVVASRTALKDAGIEVETS